MHFLSLGRSDMFVLQCIGEEAEVDCQKQFAVQVIGGIRVEAHPVCSRIVDEKGQHDQVINQLDER